MAMLRAAKDKVYRSFSDPISAETRKAVQRLIAQKLEDDALNSKVQQRKTVYNTIRGLHDSLNGAELQLKQIDNDLEEAGLEVEHDGSVDLHWRTRQQYDDAIEAMIKPIEDEREAAVRVYEDAILSVAGAKTPSEAKS